MPGHEIRKSLNLARRFDELDALDAPGNLRKPARHSENQVRVSRRIDRRDEKRQVEHHPPFRAQPGERTVCKSLLAGQRFDLHMRKPQV